MDGERIKHEVAAALIEYWMENDKDVLKLIIESGLAELADIGELEELTERITEILESR